MASRNNRYYESNRQAYGGNPRSQSGNPLDDESIAGISEDYQRVLDDDSKCSRLLKKVLRDERSFEVRLQRLQEFQTYLEKSDSNKVILLLSQISVRYATKLHLVRYENRSISN